MSKEFIRIGGAREHNLKNLTLNIPRDKLVVITGLSGSGKSSLAFDTIYAEGQRKYVESLSAYARQFLDQMQKPDVDFIEGLSPGYRDRAAQLRLQPALDHRHHHRDLRLPAPALRARRPAALSRNRRAHRRADHQRHRGQDPRPAAAHAGSCCSRRLCADQKGEFRDVVERLSREGFVRARVDGEMVELDDDVRVKLDPKEKHTIEAVVDRLVIDEKIRVRLERFGRNGPADGARA